MQQKLWYVIFGVRVSCFYIHHPASRKYVSRITVPFTVAPYLIRSPGNVGCNEAVHVDTGMIRRPREPDRP